MIGPGRDGARVLTYFDVIAFMIVTALSEESVTDDFVDVEFIQHRVGILEKWMSFPSVTSDRISQPGSDAPCSNWP